VLAAGDSREEFTPAFVKQPRNAMTTVHVADFAAQHPVLSLLPETSRAALLRASSTVTYDRGDPVWHLGHPAEEFALVLEGIVARFLPGFSERPLLAALEGPGDFADLTASLRGSRRTRTAVAYADRTRVLKLPCGPVNEALREHPDAMTALLRRTAEESDAVLERLALSAALAPARLAHLLLSLSRPAAEGRDVALRITREHMAQFIGATPETVTRTLTAWAAQGLVQKQARGLRLCEPARLARLAGGLGGDDVSVGTHPAPSAHSPTR
jgi:CRP-like cAMP-binding protein